MELTCRQCGTTFERWPAEVKRGRGLYCSRACTRDARGTPAGRLEAKLIPDGNCLIWTGTRTKAGYGQIAVDGKMWYTHRLAWTLAHGGDPDLHVLHRCDNPPCCRLEHLWLGTDADNLHDMDTKGRRVNNQAKRTRHWAARVTEEQVRDIRARASLGVPLARLGRDFGVTTSAIWRIVHQVNWRDS